MGGRSDRSKWVYEQANKGKFKSICGVIRETIATIFKDIKWEIDDAIQLIKDIIRT